MAARGWLCCALVLASNLLAYPALSCPVLSEAEEIEDAAENWIEAQRLVTEALDRADVVFVGRLIDLDRERLVRDEPGGVQAHIVRSTATFEPLVVIKGSFQSGDSLFTERVDFRVVNGEPEGRISISCGGFTWFYDIGELVQTFRYLVYASDGQILRVNTLVDWFEDLSVESELEIIHGLEQP